MRIIHERHCQQCGSTDAYDVETQHDPELQGYTRCCNERVVWPTNDYPCDPEECTHA